MLINKNLGMYTETLVNNTIQWYIRNKIAYFNKNSIPIRIDKRAKGSLKIMGKIASKAEVDYRGICQGKYIEFEVKETNQDTFLLNQLKKHQFYHLQLVNQYGGISFLLLNFFKSDQIFIIMLCQIQKLKLQKQKKLTINDAQKLGTFIPIIFPGVIDWIAALKRLQFLT